MRRGKIRIKLQCFLIIFDSPSDISLFLKDVSYVIVYVRTVGDDLQGLAIAGERLFRDFLLIVRTMPRLL